MTESSRSPQRGSEPGAGEATGQRSSTAEDDATVTLFEHTIEVPNGLHMVAGEVRPGSTFPIWVDELEDEEGRRRVLTVDQVEMSVATACELLAGLAEAIRIMAVQA